jgi:hypothetical protein
MSEAEVEYMFNHEQDFVAQLNEQVSARNASPVSEALLKDMNRVCENLRVIKRVHPNIGVVNSFANDPETGAQVKVTLV